MMMRRWAAVGTAATVALLLAGCYGSWLEGIVESFGTPDGPKITTVAGNGKAGFSGDGGPAASAELNSPHGVAVDTAGNIYIADTNNNRIRMVATDGTISTLAGSGAAGYVDNTTVSLAEFNNPLSVAVHGADVFVADFYNNAIRDITGGNVSTVAGNGTAGYGVDPGPAISAQLREPAGVAVDAAGDIFIADFDNTRVRKVVGTTITTVAGNGTGGYTGDGNAATGAEINFPYDVAADASGNLYIADTTNTVIRRVDGSTGVITTVAGNGAGGFSGDGGPATSASMSGPTGVAVDSVGNFYIADWQNNVIRKVDAGGTITTVAGNNHLGRGYAGDGNVATSAMLNLPWGVAVDSHGNLYIADTYNNRIRKVTFGP